MRLAVGSDERTHVTDAVVAELRRRAYEVALVGALVERPATADGRPELEGDAGASGFDKATAWPYVARQVAEAVAGGAADEGILFCWTGTGVSIAANKTPGIRAALCDDAETARGARLWNDANVLCLSLRRTSEVVAREILDTWFGTSYQPNETDDACLAMIDESERAGRD